jgi:HlyD family secretion protein
VIDGSLAILRPIRVGAASVEEVEILSGLEPGDKIIISDTSRFEQAERVYLRH